MSLDIVDQITAQQKLLDGGIPFVTITLVKIRGSAPQIVGAKAVVVTDGIEWGTVGGGKIEAAAVRHAQSLLADQAAASSELVVWNLQTDIGMTCGGEVHLFFDVHAKTTWPLVVYGAGHVAQSLIRLLIQLDCTVTCVDSRHEWLSKLPNHAKLKKICAEEPKSTVHSQPEHSFFILMSKGHATDLPVLKEILCTRSAPYVGVIGSHQKAKVLKRDLKAQGLEDEQIDSFYCPMGLPIGNNTPAEIAISVAAQLIARRDELGQG